MFLSNMILMTCFSLNDDTDPDLALLDYNTLPFFPPFPGVHSPQRCPPIRMTRLDPGLGAMGTP